MAFVPVFNGIKIEFLQRLEGQDVVNVMHMLAPADPDPSILEDAATQADDAFQTHILASLSDDLTHEFTVATDISQQGGQQAILAHTPATAGGVSGISAPNNVAAGVTWQTLRTGRNYRGRSYFAGVAEAVITNSRIDPLSLSGWQTAIDQFVTDMNANGFTFVVVSYRLNNAPRVTPVTTQIVTARLNAVVRTQRRRLPGVGS